MAEERQSVLPHPTTQKLIKQLKDAVADLSLLGVEVEIEMEAGEHRLLFKDVGAGLVYKQDFTASFDVEECLITSPDHHLHPDELRLD